MGRRLGFNNAAFHLGVFTVEIFRDMQGEDYEAFVSHARKADMFFLACVTSGPAVELLPQHFASAPSVVVFDSAPQLQALARLGGTPVAKPSVLQQAIARLPWTPAARALTLQKNLAELWARQQSDDLLFIFLSVIDAYITKVPAVDSLRASGIGAVACMLKNCRGQITACLADPECKAGLDCLQACSPTDQVCAYRCIVSYESAPLQDFSLCILQKHNCLGKDACIPDQPDPPPMASFRGEPLTHETAEALFIGWLGKDEWSWRVVAGQNAAYDQFPCQFQLFYRGKARNSLWYDPVFRVRKFNGEMVWRRRHYRVRRAELPGTFFFSVLDNGVISNEFWRQVDVAEDLSWALFAYSGAAAAAGQSYTGAVLCTRDGRWPAAAAEPRVNAALRLAGIEPWELFKVDNSGCLDAQPSPPLGIPAKDAATIPAKGATCKGVSGRQEAFSSRARRGPRTWTRMARTLLSPRRARSASRGPPETRRGWSEENASPDPSPERRGRAEDAARAAKQGILVRPISAARGSGGAKAGAGGSAVRRNCARAARPVPGGRPVWAPPSAAAPLGPEKEAGASAPADAKPKRAARPRKRPPAGGARAAAAGAGGRPGATWGPVARKAAPAAAAGVAAAGGAAAAVLLPYPRGRQTVNGAAGRVTAFCPRNGLAQISREASNKQLHCSRHRAPAPAGGAAPALRRPAPKRKGPVAAARARQRAGAAAEAFAPSPPTGALVAEAAEAGLGLAVALEEEGDTNSVDADDGEEVFEVEKIMDERCLHSKAAARFRIRWWGYDEADDTWEPVASLDHDPFDYEWADPAKRAAAAGAWAARTKV
ncbi:hypothetical protein WJX81_005418 [Elliptochloris bilobata]|uniref:Chromo domain-containing protein n=1 Tax=Elliptochloris bilobata TaxID=381761 RepID=A0AAW1S1H1_9CHLO